jgi:hypothetical protein
LRVHKAGVSFFQEEDYTDCSSKSSIKLIEKLRLFIAYFHFLMVSKFNDSVSPNKIINGRKLVARISQKSFFVISEASANFALPKAVQVFLDSTWWM